LQRRSEDGFLTFAAYEELGGLEGAIGRRAEEVSHALPETAQKEFVPVLRALTTVKGGKATARSAPLAKAQFKMPPKQAAGSPASAVNTNAEIE
jgi:hypothetical protein